MQFDDFFKNELLFQKGINYNDLPGWQKKGVGVYFKDIEKEGFDPIKKPKKLFVGNCMQT